MLARTRGPPMTTVCKHIRSLEAYIGRGGARLVRTTLPEWVHGRLCRELITLRAGLNPEQELLALVHEMAHWLEHRDAHSGLDCTLFEYEAEAVEALVMARLGLPCPARAPLDIGYDSPTDGLLSASVARVIDASGRICEALGLETQAPVDLEAAPCEKIVLHYEPHGVSNFLGLPQAL
jgi:hypothetical protein